MRTHTRSEADSGRGGATVIDSFTPKFQDIGEPGLVVYIDSGEPEPPQPHPPIKCHCDIPGLKSGFVRKIQSTIGHLDKTDPRIDSATSRCLVGFSGGVESMVIGPICLIRWALFVGC